MGGFPVPLSQALGPVSMGAPPPIGQVGRGGRKD